MGKVSERHKLRRGFTLFLFSALLAFILAACSRGANDPQDSTPANEALVPEATSTAVPVLTSTLMPTTTPEPTAIVPMIEVKDQVLTEDGRLSFDSVTVPDEGWLAVYQEDAGSAGDLLGYQALPPGTTSPLSVRIDARAATPTLIARLHIDGGEGGEFEFPGLDEPLKIGSKEVMATIDVDIELPFPAIEIADQTIAMDGRMEVDSVFALEPSWLVIHSVAGGSIGPAIGKVPIEAGQSDNLSLNIRWYDASKKLMALLYTDLERPGGFDPHTDLPVFNDGVPVMNEFEVTLPPDLLVYDQPVIDGKIIVERAVSSGPGWITVQQDEEGVPGLIIAFAPIEDGINELVELDLTGTAPTQILYLNLHEDTDTIGEFDFPAGDLPVLYEGELLAPFTVRTNPGNYLVTADQVLNEEKQVIIPLVVTDLDAWVALYIDDGDEGFDDILGWTWLPAGVNRNVPVTLQGNPEDNKLLAILHQDGGTSEEFDFPEGVDIPLRRNQQLIQSPITLQIPPELERNIP
ncbi:MAG: hypothetical protein R3293_00935 [Candidatus Promineifilaceae bacterium]|nr:hypothetical protein [Candidatus Promineifilaceae bacterium]